MMLKEKTARSRSDRPENSVLLSLKELRRLEDERVKAEADARRALEEAERRARAEAEQRIRDEEARRRREDEQKQRAASEREARQREERLRTEEAERRARVASELELKEQQRLEEQRRQHVPGRRGRRSPWMPAAAGATLVLALGGGLVAWASRQHQAEKEALEREIALQSGQVRAAQLAFDTKLRALEEEAHRHLGDAKTAGEAKPSKDQARILGDLQRQKPATVPAVPRSTRRTAPPIQPAAPPPPTFRLPQKPPINNEPLDGLPDIKTGGL